VSKARELVTLLRAAETSTEVGGDGVFWQRARYLLEKDNNAIASIDAIIREILPLLSSSLPTPTIKIVNQARASWLARCTWKIGKDKERGAWCGDNTEIEVQRAVLDHEQTLRRVVAHELCHHAQFMINDRPNFKRLGFEGFRMLQRFDDGHGAEWREWASVLNSKFGEKFVTKTSDSEYVENRVVAKDFYLLLRRTNLGRIYYQVATRISPKAQEWLDRKGADEYYSKDMRLVMSRDPMFLKGANIGSNGWSYFPTAEYDTDKMEQLWDAGRMLGQ
jgi:hypothetical protein